ncbi:hypothetical protein BGZ89_003263 [Linnemannia elongata]|nr:hypothetical protein BGZ89_003263 [Linnemannia elongata]
MTGREGRGKTDEPVKDQPTTTYKSRQNIFTDAFFAFKWGKVDKPADDQSMTTIKPHLLFSSDTTVSRTVKSELAQKRAGADHGDIATRVSLKDLDKQQHLILKSSHENAHTTRDVVGAWGRQCKKQRYRISMVLRSAQQGFSTAQYVVGDRYEKGRDVVQDVSKAIEWYTIAAEQGHITAQLRLGWFYANSKGVPKNDAKALVWYLKTAEQGDRRGQTLVAEACEHGRATPKNDRWALQWYIDIVETGGVDGQRKVAEFYRDGRCGSGNPQWDRLAKKWYDMVSEQDKLRILIERPLLSFTTDQSSYTYGSQYAYPPPVQPCTPTVLSTQILMHRSQPNELARTSLTAHFQCNQHQEFTRTSLTAHFHYNQQKEFGRTSSTHSHHNSNTQPTQNPSRTLLGRLPPLERNL